MTTSAGPVVVGVDGSESSLDAVRLAAREAAVRTRPLLVVHAFVWALVRVPLGPTLLALLTEVYAIRRNASSPTPSRRPARRHHRCR